MAQSPVTQFSGIFVSYRRDDSSGHAGRLFDNLADHFGKDRIFMDIDTIEPGEDFVAVIENAVGSCDVLVAIIGRRWLEISGGSERRLDNPNDFVRLEIAAAIKRGIRLIPVLVQGANMPKPTELPVELAKLSYRNALELSDSRWRHDVERLIRAIDKVLAQEEARLISGQEQPKLDQVPFAEAAQPAEEVRQRVEAEEKLRSDLETQGKLAAEEKEREVDKAQRNEDEERQKLVIKASTQGQPVVSRPGPSGFLGVKTRIWIGAVVLLLVVGAVVAIWLPFRNRSADERSSIEPAVASSPTPVESPTQSASPTSPTQSLNGAGDANKNANNTKVIKPDDSGRAEKQRKAREAAIRQKCATWALDHDGPCPYK